MRKLSLKAFSSTKGTENLVKLESFKGKLSIFLKKSNFVF